VEVRRGADEGAGRAAVWMRRGWTKDDIEIPSPFHHYILIYVYKDAMA